MSPRSFPPRAASAFPSSNPMLLALLPALVLGACGREGETSSPLHLRASTEGSGLTMVLRSGEDIATQILEVKGGGLALVDFDGDGDRDVFAPNGATLSGPFHGAGARLFENQGGLKFRDVTAASGITFARWGFGCAVADYDADGDEDVYVACYGENALLRNEGDGTFRDVTEEAGAGAGDGWSTAAAFGDVDGDGDLDLYVVDYIDFDPANPPGPASFLNVKVFAGPAGLPARADVLLLNQGDGTFRDASEESGIRSVAPSYGLGVLILDFDGDHDNEIFVGNDSGKNFLFQRGEDGRFRDIGVVSGIASNLDGGDQATMGIALGDVDGNGTPDVFSTNFMNDTNTLHVNLGVLGDLGHVLFEDRTQQYGLALDSRPFLGWATAFVDFDHDGDEDLLVFNGHVYPPTIADAEGRNWKHDQEPLLYERRERRFERLSAEVAGEWLAERHCDRSAVFDDLDGDGDVDVIVGELNGPLRLLENDGAPGAWMIVELRDGRGGAMNRRGLGAKVELIGAGPTLTRWIHGGGSYQAANPPMAHFGLGSAEAPVRLRVTWPDGEVQEAGPFPPRQRVLVERSE